MPTSFSTLDWRAMSQRDRDLGLNNGVAVPGSMEMVAGWAEAWIASSQVLLAMTVVDRPNPTPP
jgi:hypothetical protein